MPIRISVKHDFDRAAAKLTAIERKHLPFATAAALTDTAKAAGAKVTADLPTIFDGPVPFTLRAVGTRSATKSTLAAEVFIKRLQAQYLLPEEIGGERSAANNTRRPGAPFSVPGKIPLNASGNIPDGAIKALGELAKTTARGEKPDKQTLRRLRALASKVGRKGQPNISIAYLKGSGPGGKGPGGFFERLPNRKITRLTSFETTARYHPRFGFRASVTKTASQTFATALRNRLTQALATAR